MAWGVEAEGGKRGRPSGSMAVVISMSLSVVGFESGNVEVSAG